MWLAATRLWRGGAFLLWGLQKRGQLGSELLPTFFEERVKTIESLRNVSQKVLVEVVRPRLGVGTVFFKPIGGKSCPLFVINRAFEQLEVR